VKNNIRTLVEKLSQVSPSPEAEIDSILKTEFGISLIKFRTLGEQERILEILARIVDERIRTGKPFQYITGHALFMDEIFLVNSNVLIPRAETEVLVETASHFIKQKSLKRVVDVGTGSGVVAITLKKRHPDIQVVATDISSEALKIARKNALIHRTNVKFVQCNLLSCLSGPFDLIVSNPPYIGKDDPYEEYRKFEPEIALSGGEKGYELSLELINQAMNRLSKSGYIIIEINPYVVNEMMGKISGFNTQIIKDLNGVDRVMVLWMT